MLKLHHATISEVESKSETSIQNNATRMKLILEKLIMLPLEDLANPNHEASVKESLAILDLRMKKPSKYWNLSFDFPTIIFSV